ncbi:MAG: hypothetical protein MMC33_000065 [Icmadophila ericetorum]|nr:hypothetical protein [Icmadophila ericetorum]
MADSKKKAIRNWQQKEAAKSPDTATAALPEATTSIPDSSKPMSRTTLLEEAAKFLQTEGVRESSAERKVKFLESKGLTSEEIEVVLGVTPTYEAAKASTSTQASDAHKSQDVPPIITYPEFLLHSQKPPPLITAQRLLYTLYFASGVAATIYGTSKYLVSPMVESLTSARHSLFETASSNLEVLEEKLGRVVSTIPVSAKQVGARLAATSNEEDNESIASDPAELFHRDTGTQTSILDSPSSSSSIDLSKPTPGTNIFMQTNRLKALHSQASDILSGSDNLEKANDDVKSEIADLQKYLDGVMWGRTYNYIDMSAGKIQTRREDDEIAKVKAEIRGVKGVLLNAKSFPAGGLKGRARGY